MEVNCTKTPLKSTAVKIERIILKMSFWPAASVFKPLTWPRFSSKANHLSGKMGPGIGKWITGT